MNNQKIPLQFLREKVEWRQWLGLSMRIATFEFLLLALMPCLHWASPCQHWKYVPIFASSVVAFRMGMRSSFWLSSGWSFEKWKHEAETQIWSKDIAVAQLFIIQYKMYQLYSSAWQQFLRRKVPDREKKKKRPISSCKTCTSHRS